MQIWAAGLTGLGLCAKDGLLASPSRLRGRKTHRRYRAEVVRQAEMALLACGRVVVASRHDVADYVERCSKARRGLRDACHIEPVDELDGSATRLDRRSTSEPPHRGWRASSEPSRGGGLEVNFRREHMPIDTEPEPTMHTRNVRAKARVCAPSYGSVSIATSYAYDQTL